MNFSDHLPIAVSVECPVSTEFKKNNSINDKLSPTSVVSAWTDSSELLGF